MCAKLRKKYLPKNNHFIQGLTFLFSNNEDNIYEKYLLTNIFKISSYISAVYVSNSFRFP